MNSTRRSLLTGALKDAFLYLGVGYDKKGLYNKAVKNLQNALQLDPDNPTVLYHIGVCYNRMDDPKKAIPPLKRATEINPDDGKAYYYLGVVYDKAGELDKAKENYRAADLKFQKSESTSGAR